ncbi:hypothetical protein KIN20_032171 [Parelaphostrongylus tenuis]|uniref:Uncharacterized protein n=1 Tax=Parelaphostrongylus tenuis TaxID=148309 RepID=A0AAD5WHJ5_PARTN|nr:hypothetical protein KIN20_032171 [Parelaphostrongylus tenuis]
MSVSFIHKPNVNISGSLHDSCSILKSFRTHSHEKVSTVLCYYIIYLLPAGAIIDDVEYTPLLCLIVDDDMRNLPT